MAPKADAGVRAGKKHGMVAGERGHSTKAGEPAARPLREPPALRGRCPGQAG